MSRHGHRDADVVDVVVAPWDDVDRVLEVVRDEEEEDLVQEVAESIDDLDDEVDEDVTVHRAAFRDDVVVVVAVLVHEVIPYRHVDVDYCCYWDVLDDLDALDVVVDVHRDRVVVEVAVVLDCEDEVRFLVVVVAAVVVVVVDEEAFVDVVTLSSCRVVMADVDGDGDEAVEVDVVVVDLLDLKI